MAHHDTTLPATDTVVKAARLARFGIGAQMTGSRLLVAEKLESLMGRDAAYEAAGVIMGMAGSSDAKCIVDAMGAFANGIHSAADELRKGWSR